MKKSLVVLLIAVLALTSAFAAITGTVAAEYSFDLDKKTANYEPWNLVYVTFDYNQKITLGTEAADYPYIDVALYNTYTFSTQHSTSYKYEPFKWTKFQIVGEDWTLNFLGKFGTIDYAKSAIDSKSYDELYSYSLQKKTGNKLSAPYTYTWLAADGKYSGYALKFTKDNVGSISFIGDQSAATTDTNLTEVGVELESVNFNLTEDIKAQAAFSIDSKKETGDEAAEVKVGVSAKLAYADISHVEADFGWTKAGLLADVAFNAKYGVFTFDTYYTNAQTVYYFDANYKTSSAQFGYTPVTTLKTTDKGYFSAKAVANVEDINTKFTVTGKNLLDSVNYTVAFDVTTTYFNHFTFGVNVANLTKPARVFKLTAKADFTEEYGATAYAILSALNKYNVPTLSLGATWTDGILTVETSYDYDFAEPKAYFDFMVEYAAEAYTAYAGVNYNTYATTPDVTGEDYTVYDGWYLTAGIESDAVVNGATLALEYASRQLDAEPAGLGTITASCTVEL